MINKMIINFHCSSFTKNGSPPHYRPGSRSQVDNVCFVLGKTDVHTSQRERLPRGSRGSEGRERPPLRFFPPGHGGRHRGGFSSAVNPLRAFTLPDAREVG